VGEEPAFQMYKPFTKLHHVSIEQMGILELTFNVMEQIKAIT
jgi:hypothetical protein